jgi:hypothetical protein
MKDRVLFFGISLAMSALSPSVGLSQTQAAQNRIPQQIVIHGQLASGAYVTTATGQLQSFTCPSPQQYTTADGSSQGWACYEHTTGVWLLNAAAPTQAVPAPPPAPQPVPQAIPQQPPVVYQPAPPVVVYPQTQPAVIYQQPSPTVIYTQPPTIIYQEPSPTVVYAPSRRPVVVAPAYPSSVVLGRAAIEAAGRIASAAVLSSRRSNDRYYYYDDDDRGRRRNKGNRGRGW